AAYGPALTDVVVLSEQGRIFVTGPDVVRSVTGEDVTMARLGGPEPHSRRSGVVHVVAPSDADAIERARELALLPGGQAHIDPSAAAPDGAPDLGSFLPDSPRRAYDVKPMIAAPLDGPGIQLHPRRAPNIVTHLRRLARRTARVRAT